MDKYNISFLEELTEYYKDITNQLPSEMIKKMQTISFHLTDQIRKEFKLNFNKNNKYYDNRITINGKTFEVTIRISKTINKDLVIFESSPFYGDLILN